MKSNRRVLAGTPPVNVNKSKASKMNVPSSLRLGSLRVQQTPKSDSSMSSFESKQELLRQYLMFKEESTNPKKPPAGRVSAEVLKQFKNDDDRFMITERFIFLLGLLYTVLAVVAVLFYENKRALYLTGIPCQLHVYKHYLLQVAKKFGSSIVNLVINIFWLLFVLSLTIVYLVKDNREPDKIEFTDEIILHVGLIIYSPFVVYSCYLSIRMISLKVEFLDVYNEINEMG